MLYLALRALLRSIPHWLAALSGGGLPVPSGSAVRGPPGGAAFHRLNAACPRWWPSLVIWTRGTGRLHDTASGEVPMSETRVQNEYCVLVFMAHTFVL